VPLITPAAGKIKRCACGLTYQRREPESLRGNLIPGTWEDLALVGVSEDAVNKLELRNCTCGSTISIALVDKVWTLDGVTIDVDEFMLANKETLTQLECRELETLPAGEEMHFGGGAAPLAILRRIQ
jgi:hypothetical protein